jgi:hypothetical protein
MKQVGDKVILVTSRSRLSYSSLIQHGWTEDTLVEIIKVDKNNIHPYLIQLPDLSCLWITDRDIK